MKAYVFPGQGSQVKGMGGDLFDKYKELVDKADEILGYSIKELCLEDPRNQLTQTQFTQPALYVVNSLSFLDKVEETGSEPRFVAGHSVGEYAALFAAKVYDFETGLKIIRYRGQLMSEAKGGAMAAVIGLNAEEVHKVLEDNALDTIDVANYNSLTQIVISGKEEDIKSAKEIFDKSGARMYVPLKVSGAFHSRYMKEAGDKFSSFVEKFEYDEPRISIIANVDAQPYEVDTVKENLSRQIVSSVQWYKTIKYILGQGVEDIEEVGPGRVLAGLIQRIKKEA